MGLVDDILGAVGKLAADTALIVVKTGYEVGRGTGKGIVKGTVSGTASVVKEIAKKATGN